MNNGRPNQGNPGMWGQQAGQGGQPMPYRTNPGVPGGSQQPYQQSQQPYPQGYAPRGGTQMGAQPAGYPQGNQQPYQQGFRQPVYQRPPQGNAAYQQPQQQRQPMQQPMQQPQYQNTQFQNTQYQTTQFQQTQYRQPYPGQPYPGYPQPYPGQQPPQPQQRQKKPFDPAIVLWVLLCGVLPVLFVLGFVLSDLAVLKWVFVGAAVITLACLWIKPAISSNARLTFSGVYGALAVVALVSALTATVPADTNTDPQGGSQLSSQLFQQDSGGDTGLGEWYTEVPVSTATPAPDGLQSAAVEQMKSFFYFWSVNNQDNMLTLCAPSWRKSVSDPKVKLFSILANRTPVEYEAEKITGTENDTTRTITVTALINKNNGKDPEKYRFQVIMRKEDDQWYVDPASLESHETVATTAPTANDTATPTAEFIATANTVLYYNANGGERYHLDAYCKSANEKYLPFTGQFYYSQLDEDAYKDLVACNVCGAPLRQ